MSSSVLFFSCEPGGAEVLIPAVLALKEQPGLDVRVAAYGPGLARFRAKNIACEEISPVTAGSTDIFTRFSPDLLITSAASLPHKDMSEKFLWKHARAAGVKTLAFLDQWQNYAVRFSGPSPQERLAYQPDLINCLNLTGFREMLAEGFAAEKLVQLGHPYLSWLAETAGASDVPALRSGLGIPPEVRNLLFVSEPILENYGDARGYTQYSVLDFFASRVWPGQKNAVLTLKLHPKDDPSKYRGAAELFGPRLKLLGGQVSPFDCLLAADKVYGMTSVMLIEAYILGKETVSLQPGLRVQDPLVLSRQKRIKLITSELDLNTPFAPPPGSAFDFEFNKDKFIGLVRELTA